MKGFAKVWLVVVVLVFLAGSVPGQTELYWLDLNEQPSQPANAGAASVWNKSGDLYWGSEALAVSGDLDPLVPADGTQNITGLLHVSDDVATSGSLYVDGDVISTGTLTGSNFSTASNGRLYVGNGTIDAADLGTGTQLLGDSFPSITSGATYNSVFGFAAGDALTTGDLNVFIGYRAGSSATTMEQGVAIGRDALYSATDGIANVAIGESAGRAVTTGEDNVFIGSDAGWNSLDTAGAGFTTGAHNTFVGNNAGMTFTSVNASYEGQTPLIGNTGSYNSSLGQNAGFSGGTATFRTAIGANAIADTDNTIVLGTPNETVIARNDMDVAGDLDVAGAVNAGADSKVSEATLEIETATDTAAANLLLDQDDTDQPFIKFEGSSASNFSANISTVTGDGSVVGPKARATADGYTFGGCTLDYIDGVGEVWRPYYIADPIPPECPRVDAWIVSDSGDGRWVEVGRAIRFNKGEESIGWHSIELEKPAERFRIVEDEKEKSHVFEVLGDGVSWGLGSVVTEPAPRNMLGADPLQAGLWSVEFSFERPVSVLETFGFYERVE